MKKILFNALFFILSLSEVYARDVEVQSSPTIVINRRDRAAQERGAALFMTACSGCHSLKQVRYTDLARHFGWVDQKTDRIQEDLIHRFLKFHDLPASSPILPALTREQGELFFGSAPPDLSLVLRYRSAQWVSDMLHSYFYDPSRPTGVNNNVFKQTAMPHVLIHEQGWQAYGLDGPGPQALYSQEAGQDYDHHIHDLIAFLDYVAEPKRLERETLGKYVILFCIALSVINYLYYRSVWAQVDRDQAEDGDEDL